MVLDVRGFQKLYSGLRSGLQHSGLARLLQSYFQQMLSDDARHHPGGKAKLLTGPWSDDSSFLTVCNSVLYN